MRGLEMDGAPVSHLQPIAPVAGLDPHPGRVAADNRVVAERGDYKRIVPRLEPGERRTVEMIVVVVTEEDQVDRRQVLEADARRVDPLRAKEGEGRNAGRPDRIGQYVQA